MQTVIIDNESYQVPDDATDSEINAIASGTHLDLSKIPADLHQEALSRAGIGTPVDSVPQVNLPETSQGGSLGTGESPAQIEAPTVQQTATPENPEVTNFESKHPNMLKVPVHPWSGMAPSNTNPEQKPEEFKGPPTGIISLLDQTTDTMGQGWKDLKDLAAPLNPKDPRKSYSDIYPDMDTLPPIKNLRQKKENGEKISLQDYEQAFLAAAANNPAGKVLGAVNTLPIPALATTVISNSLIPAFAKVTGINPEDLQILLTGLGLKGGLKQAKSAPLLNLTNKEGKFSLKGLPASEGGLDPLHESIPELYPIKHPIKTAKAIGSAALHAGIGTAGTAIGTTTKVIKPIVQPVARAVLEGDNFFTEGQGINSAMKTPEAEQAADLGKRLGVNFSVGELTGNPTARNIEDYGANTAKTANIYSEANKAKTGAIITNFKEALDNIYPQAVSKVDVGNKLATSYHKTLKGLEGVRRDQAKQDFSAALEGDTTKPYIATDNLFRVANQLKAEGSSRLLTPAKAVGAKEGKSLISKLSEPIPLSEREGGHLDEFINKARNYKAEKTGTPFLTHIRSRGGVKIGSVLDSELRARGLNPKNTGSLFKKSGGLEDIDNLPANEFKEKFGLETVPEDGNGYVDRDFLIDALENEKNGKSLKSLNPADEETQSYKDLSDTISKEGLDIKTATNDQIKKVVYGYDTANIATRKASPITLEEMANGLSDFSAMARQSGGIFENMKSAALRRVYVRLHQALLDDLQAAIDNPETPAPRAAALKKARDNYAENTNKIADIENTTIGKMIGETSYDTEGNLNIIPEKVAKKFDSMEPSEILNTLKFLDQTHPDVADMVRRYTLEKALNKAIEGRGAREDISKPFPKAEFIGKLPNKDMIQSLLKNNPHAAGQVMDVIDGMNRIINFGASRRGSDTAMRLSWKDYFSGSQLAKSIAAGTMAEDLLNGNKRGIMAKEVETFEEIIKEKRKKEGGFIDYSRAKNLDRKIPVNMDTLEKTGNKVESELIKMGVSPENIDRDTSRVSESEYLRIHNPETGNELKLRMSNHNLPHYYTQADMNLGLVNDKSSGLNRYPDFLNLVHHSFPEWQLTPTKNMDAYNQKVILPEKAQQLSRENDQLNRSNNFKLQERENIKNINTLPKELISQIMAANNKKQNLRAREKAIEYGVKATSIDALRYLIKHHYKPIGE